MTKSSKPELVQQFENLLWANSPKDWVVKTVYFQGTLFVSMSVEAYQFEHCQKIHRSFSLDIINDRSQDLDEMKTEITN